MRKTLTVAGAVAAILGGSSAFALTPTQINNDITNGTITIVNITGSSAFRDEMVNAFSSLCAAGTLDQYGGDASGDSTHFPAPGVRNWQDGYSPDGVTFYSYNGPDFRGYACTLKNPVSTGTPALSGLAGSDVLVYYRAEGGSVWGVAPVAFNAGVQHLSIPNLGPRVHSNPGNVGDQEGCYQFTAGGSEDNGVAVPAHAAANATKWLCAIPLPNPNITGAITPPSNTFGWWLPLDNFTGPGGASQLAPYTNASDLAVDPPTMGVTDIEPAGVSGKNYPTGYVTADGTAFGSGLSQTQLASLTSNPVLQQAFGIIVNNSATSAVTKNLTNLSRVSVTGILTGKYTNWSQVPEAGGVAAPITICRRDPGSGTQTATSIFFGNVYCGAASGLETVTQMKAPNGTTVQQFPTTGDVQACVGQTNDAVGISSFGTGSAPPGGKFISIDSVAVNQANLLNNTYKEWFEVVYAKGPGFSSATANQQSLVNGLIQGTADSTVGAVPANVGYAYIPNQPDVNGDNPPSVANLSKFINVFGKKGNSCNTVLQPQNTN